MKRNQYIEIFPDTFREFLVRVGLETDKPEFDCTKYAHEAEFPVPYYLAERNRS